MKQSRHHVRYNKEESKIFARYTRLLMSGEYASIAAAARACLHAHVRLRKHLSAPIPPRRFNGVKQAIGIAARKLGRAPAFQRWTPAELRIVKRYSRAVVTGQYRNALAALPDCRAELAGRHTASSTLSRLRRHAREMGRSITRPKWTREEKRVADRFAKAVVRGEYSCASAAMDDCIRALIAAGLDYRSRARVQTWLIHRSQNLGRKPRLKRWTPGEVKIVERHARALADGRIESGGAAAALCRQALTEAGFAPRTMHGVRHRLLKAARALGRPGGAPAWSTQEAARIERIARDYAKGKYPNIESAAAAALKRLARGRLGGLQTPSGVKRRILARAHELGRPMGWRLWTDAEDKACETWIRWYERHRSIRRYRPFKEAINGLMEDTQNLGSERTYGACRTHFLKSRRILLGIK